MKILQLGKAYPPVNFGGVEVVIKLLAEGLNKEHYECDALGVNDNYTFKEEMGDFGGRIYRTRLLFKAFSTLISPQLITYLNDIKDAYDVIHIHSPDPMAAIALFLCRPKAKIVLHWHSDILKQRVLLFFYNPILWWLLKKSNLIIATSPNYIFGSKYLLRFRYKTEVLPIGLDVSQTSASAYLDKRLKLKYSDKKIIFSLGRLSYYKGFDYLTLAAINLPEDYTVVIAGEGTERKKLLNLIKKNNLENKVKLVGKITEEEKHWYFQNSLLFALSSIYKTEAYAIVQVEALAYGLPIVSTQIEGSGVDWVNQDGLTGITVPIMNELEIAKAILRIATDEVLYNTFRNNSLIRYQELFTEKKMIERQIELYEKL